MPDETFDKETVEKEDGRYIIFYTFDDGTPDDRPDKENREGDS